jgi:hypothetical protein
MIETNVVRRIIFLILLSLLIAPAIIQNINAIGPYPCFFYLQPLDKVEYELGETVTIKVQHCREDSTDTATLLIADGLKDLSHESDIWQKFAQGKEVLYEERKQAVYGDVEFNYTIPKDSPTYRYVVLVTPGQMGGFDTAFFFSKKDASRVVISDVKILNPQVKQNDNLSFEMKVTDGLGNPLPNVRVGASATYMGCEGLIEQLNDIIFSGKSQYEKEQYFSQGIFWGWVPIGLGKSGTYELNVAASADYPGFTRSEVKSIKFEILSEAAKQDRLELYTDIADYPLSEYTGYRNFTDIRITSGDALYVTGQLKLSQCAPSSQQNIPVKVELLEVQMNMDEAQKRFGTNAIRYGSDVSCYKFPSVCSARTIETRQLETTVFRSDSTFIAVPQDMLKQATLKPGEYMVTISTEFQGSNYQNSVGIRVHNTKDYIIKAEGKEFGVVVDAWYSKPGELEFNKDSKKISIDVDTSVEPKMVDIFIPHELLDGSLSVIVNDEKVLEEEALTFSREVNLTKDATWSHITLFPQTDNTKVEIIGTMVVPEFPVGIVILGMSVGGIIIATRFIRGVRN